MLNQTDIDWINANREEVSLGRMVDANFYYEGYTDEDIDTGEPGTIYDDLPPILVSGVFKDKGLQKVILDNKNGAEIFTKLFIFIYNTDNVYIILNEENRIVRTDGDAVTYLSLPSIPTGYEEKLKKIEIPANSGNYYALVDYKQLGMKGDDYNKIGLNLIDYYRIFD